MAIVQDRFTEELSSNFFTLPGEKLLLATRKHWFVLAIPLVITGIVSFMFVIFSSFLLLFFPSFPILFFLTTLVIVLFTLSYDIKLIIDWYFHIYLVTSRKILEVCYSPFFSYNVNDVLLDQVRCTEVDVRTDGIVNELLNLGDVTVTFDRPTHQEAFVFLGISDPKKVGIFLGDALDFERGESRMQVWYKGDGKNTQNLDGEQKKKFRFMEEIFPRSIVG